MNTAKIAALYAASHYDLIVKYSGADNDISETFAWGLHRAIWFDDRQPSADASQPEKYRITINDGEKRKRLNEIGDTEYGLADTFLPKRVFDWALGLMPADDNERASDMMMVALHASYSQAAGKEDEHVMRLEPAGRFGNILRGILAYENKRRKYYKKTLKQLAAYHQQGLAQAAAEEEAKLKRGVWLGANKAITTAARVDEPGIPFMGDTSLTREAREALDLRYYAVCEGMIGTESEGFPIGTGLAIKPVNRSSQLVDGAVYLWQWMINGKSAATMLGRLDLSQNRRGHLPLRAVDTGEIPLFCWVPWSKESGVKLYRVTHYTTRSAAPATSQPLSSTAFLALSMGEQRQYDAERELALAA